VERNKQLKRFKFLNKFSNKSNNIFKNKTITNFPIDFYRILHEKIYHSYLSDKKVKDVATKDKQTKNE